MKLYRGVKASANCKTFYTPRGEPIHLEPIEITEGEIDEVITEYTHAPGAYGSEFVFGTEEAAKAILSKLSGE